MAVVFVVWDIGFPCSPLATRAAHDCGTHAFTFHVPAPRPGPVQQGGEGRRRPLHCSCHCCCPLAGQRSKRAAQLLPLPHLQPVVACRRMLEEALWHVGSQGVRAGTGHRTTSSWGQRGRPRNMNGNIKRIGSLQLCLLVRTAGDAGSPSPGLDRCLQPAMHAREM